MNGKLATGIAVMMLALAASAVAQERGADGGALALGSMSAAAHSIAGAEIASGVRELGNWLPELDAIRGELERNDGFIGTDDEVVLALLFAPDEGESQLLRRYMKSLVVAMDEVPYVFYDNLDAKIDSLWGEIRRLAPKLRPITGEPVDLSMQTAVARRLGQSAPGAQLLGTVLAGDRWVARFDDLGLPRTEYRRGYVTYRLPGQPLAVCQQIVIERPYFVAANGATTNYDVKLGYLRMQEL